MPRTAKIAQADIARTLRAFRGLGIEAEVQRLHDGTMVVSSPKKRVYSQVGWREIKKQNQAMLEKSKSFYCCVYFVESAGYVKIGYARDLADRLERLQMGCPHLLCIRGVIEGSKIEEGNLHLKFADHRSRGEWFVYADEIAAYIRETA